MDRGIRIDLIFRFYVALNQSKHLLFFWKIVGKLFNGLNVIYLIVNALDLEIAVMCNTVLPPHTHTHTHTERESKKELKRQVRTLNHSRFDTHTHGRTYQK